MRARDADKPAPAPLRLLLLAAAPAALHALWFLGRLHPDETFQVLEPALHRGTELGTPRSHARGPRHADVRLQNGRARGITRRRPAPSAAATSPVAHCSA